MRTQPCPHQPVFAKRQAKEDWPWRTKSWKMLVFQEGPAVLTLLQHWRPLFLIPVFRLEATLFDSDNTSQKQLGS